MPNPRHGALGRSKGFGKSRVRGPILRGGRTIPIAQAIVAKKVKAEGHGKENGWGFLAGLQRAKTADDVRQIEAQAAQEFWRQWADFKMLFKGSGVPAE
jgi:hypothetical protein